MPDRAEDAVFINVYRIDGNNEGLVETYGPFGYTAVDKNFCDLLYQYGLHPERHLIRSVNINEYVLLSAFTMPAQ